MAGSASEHSLLDHSSHAHSHHHPRHRHSIHDDRPQPDPQSPQHDLDNGSHGKANGHPHGSDNVTLRPREALPQDPAPPSVPQINTDNLVTQVIQTVSLIQYVDPAGSPFDTQTFYAPPNTVVIDTVSGNTVAISIPDAPPLTAIPDPATGASATGTLPEPSASVPAPVPFPSDPATSDAIPSIPQPSLSDPLPALPEPSLPPSDSASLSQSLPLLISESSTTQLPEVTSSISTDSPVLSTPAAMIGSLNSTNTAPGTIPSSSIPSNSTLSMLIETTSAATPSVDTETATSTKSKSSSRSSTLSESILSSITSEFASSTGTAIPTGGFGGIGTGDDSLPGDPAPTSTSPADSGSPPSGGLSPKNKQIVGGVVGSIAGFAMLAVLLLLLLRHRRKKDGQPFFSSGPASGSRGITGSDAGGPAGPSMTERAGPFAVAAALASLNKKASPPPTATEERGFYRVSGKKLPSVLHAGGDGYTDPRESVMSGNSDYYRGSQEFDPNVAGGVRLALGSPMRPVSGVPIIRTGPARVAVTVPEDNPFSDPPAAPRDPLGRSLIHQDGSRGSGSRGSGSRFHERI